MMLNQLSIKLPHGNPKVRIESNDCVLLQYICRNLLPYARMDETETDVDELVIRVNKESLGYSICYCSKKFFVEDNLRVVQYLGRILNNAISIDYPFIGLHCAVLSKDEYNNLFVGETGVGKSTLSVYLASKGFVYHSDDKALVDCVQNNVIPFNKPIHLRIGGKAVLEEIYGICPDGYYCRIGAEERFCVPCQKNCSSAANAIRIYFIERLAEESTSVSRLPVYDAFNRIVHNLVYIKKLDEGIRLALMLVSNVECYLLRYSTLFDIEKIL